MRLRLVPGPRTEGSGAEGEGATVAAARPLTFLCPSCGSARLAASRRQTCLVQFPVLAAGPEPSRGSLVHREMGQVTATERPSPGPRSHNGRQQLKPWGLLSVGPSWRKSPEKRLQDSQGL